MKVDKKSIPIKKLKKHYKELIDIAKIFHHEVIEDYHGTWRWKENFLIRKVTDLSSFDYNAMAVSILGNKKEFTLEEYMKLYMQIGYSLSGFIDVFGQREVTDYGLEYLSPPPKKFDFENKYYQTPIEYMKLKYKNQVLKL